MSGEGRGREEGVGATPVLARSLRGKKWIKLHGRKAGGATEDVGVVSVGTRRWG